MTATANTAPTISAHSGYAVLRQDAGLGATAFLPDGKILNTVWHALYRLNPDGSLDAGFGAGGSVEFTAYGAGSTYRIQKMSQITLQADGKVLLSGYATGKDASSLANTSMAMLRLNADGTVDRAFGSDGATLVNFGTGMHSEVVSTVLLPDGKILSAGRTSPFDSQGQALDGADQAVLWRLRADGTPDPSFGKNGYVLDGLAAFDTQQMVVQLDGKIVCLGAYRPGGEVAATSFGVLRFNADGTRDTGFGVNGFAKASAYSNPHAMTLQADGKLLIVGESDVDSHAVISVMRLNADGSRDMQFGSGGQVIKLIGIDGGAPPATGTTHTVGNYVHVADDGSILVAGMTMYISDALQTQSRVVLMRLHADGSTDTTFGIHGALAMAPFVPLGRLTGETYAIAPDGDVVVAGMAWPASTNDTPHVSGVMLRINPDGTVDQGFGQTVKSDSVTTSVIQGAPPTALLPSAMVTDAELAGALTNYAGATLTVARAGADSVDDHFAGSGALTLAAGVASVNGVAIGSFTNAGGHLAIAFNAKATQDAVNSTLQSITYSNSGTPGEIKLNWIFSDGNAGLQGSGGALASTLAVTVGVKAAEAAYWIDAALARPDGMSLALLRQQFTWLLGDGGTFNPKFDALFGAADKLAAGAALDQLFAATALHADANGAPLNFHPRADLAGAATGTLSAFGGNIYFTGTGTDGTAAVLHGLEQMLGVKTTGSEAIDLAALQFLYGPNPKVRSGNDVYPLDADHANFIWDGGGSDTISAAGLKQGVNLHLSSGQWDYIGERGAAITAAGQITINYGSDIENAIGGSGNDTFYGNALANLIDGGAGTDTMVYDKTHTAYTVKASGNDWLVDNDTLRSVEQLQFADGYFSFDANGNAGQLYRLFQAVFGRAADAPGLGYWIAQMNAGASLGSVAGNFIDSKEFVQRFGEKVSNDDFLNALYSNVLHRTADAAGFAYWKGLLDSHAVSNADALIQFSQSPENTAQLIGAMQSGMQYIPFHN